ncbi:hypothetical protein SMD44_00587 [Streptomyces alboflavus]|uniref:Uncharacterized protein n=1 Tax=Streptomyces alboflavus TaxID=67267 RepID=A0A1Z1W466_9ACTN|nr:hypothetical protein SMD44_00587 [Streptomyces alboflavus]
MRLQVVEPIRRDLLGPHPGLLLSGREVAQGAHPVLVGGDDQAPLVSYSICGGSSRVSSRHSSVESRASSSSGPGSLSETRRLPSPDPVVPPETGPRSTTVTVRPACAA